MKTRLDYLIVSDASVKYHKQNGLHDYAAYATYILNLHDKTYVGEADELIDRTIQYAEAYAVYRGIKLLSTLTNPDARIIVVSDNNNVISALGKWTRDGTWNLQDRDYWRKNDGSPVANQDVYRHAMDAEKYFNTPIRYVHIHSHLSSSVTSHKKICREFAEYGVNIDTSTASVLLRLNAMADFMATTLTRNAFEYERKHGLFMELNRVHNDKVYEHENAPMVASRSLEHIIYTK